MMLAKRRAYNIKMRAIRARRAAHARRMRSLRAKRAALAARLAANKKKVVVKAAPACTTCATAAPAVTMKQTTVVNAK
jgi:hypothetical protein